MVGRVFTFLSMVFGSVWGVICQAASVIGLVVVFTGRTWAIYVALFFICLSLISFIIAFVYFISKRFGTKYPEGFKRIASFCFYRTDDGVNITCTTKRIIQGKSLSLPEINHNFKWTGKTQPQISAGKHKVVANITTTGSGEYDFDIAKIRLSEPLLYDETAVINVASVVNDADGVSKPFLGTKVEYPTGHLVFNIFLGHKPSNFREPATLQRKKLKCDLAEFETLAVIPFDSKHKMYYYEMDNPDIGYIYKIEWKK